MNKRSAKSISYSPTKNTQSNRKDSHVSEVETGLEQSVHPETDYRNVVKKI